MIIFSLKTLRFFSKTEFIHFIISVSETLCALLFIFVKDIILKGEIVHIKNMYMQPISGDRLTFALFW